MKASEMCSTRAAYGLVFKKLPKEKHSSLLGLITGKEEEKFNLEPLF
jgi:hypothetical protein